MVTDVVSSIAVGRLSGRHFRDYEQAISETTASFAGIGNLVEPEMRVLLKPSIVVSSDSKLSTNIELIRAVGREVVRAGAEVMIGDSPVVIGGRMERIWRESGLQSLADEEGFELVNFERSGSCSVAVNTRTYYISRPVLSADLVINLPRIQQDSYSPLYGALGNMYGVLPGFQKRFHLGVSEWSANLAEVLVDLFSVVAPGLTISEICSPFAAKSDPVESYLLASEDALAIESTVARLFGLATDQVEIISQAAEAGLGLILPIDIDPGRKPNHKSRTNYSQVFQKLGGKLSAVWSNVIDPLLWIKPNHDQSICQGCSDCVVACPTNALTYQGSGRRVKFNENLCVSCWNCLESCGKITIPIQESWVASRLLQRQRKFCAT